MARIGLIPLCLALLFPLQEARAQTCQEIVSRLPRLSGGADLVAQNTGGRTYKELYDECDRRDRFAGAALPTFRGRPLKCSTDNRVDLLKQFSDRTIVFRAKAAVDADGSPASTGPGASPTDQTETWLTFDAGSNRHFVNAEDVPFVVVPTPFQAKNIPFLGDTGLGKGDRAVAVNGNRCSFGVVGDAGPYFRLGEASIATPTDPCHPQGAVAGQRPSGGPRPAGAGWAWVPADLRQLPGHADEPLLARSTRSAGSAAAGRALTFFRQIRADAGTQAFPPEHGGAHMPGPSFDLSGRTALVTGGGSGLGLAMAEGLAAAGAAVVVVGRDKGKLEAGAKAIGAAGAEACHSSTAPRSRRSSRASSARTGRSRSSSTTPASSTARRSRISRPKPGTRHTTAGHDRDASVGAVLPCPGGRTRHGRAAPRQDHQHALGHVRARAADDHPLRASAKGGLRMLTRGARGRARAAQHPGQRASGPGYFTTEITAP